MFTAKNVLAVAEAELGYLEKASNNQLDDKTANSGKANYTKYGAWFGINPAQWCAMFVSWVLANAGANTDIFYSYCYIGINQFKAKAQFHTRISGYVPRPGDVLFFDSATLPNGGGHTGIVESCENGYVYTIEGNASTAWGVTPNGGGVVRKIYKMDYGRIFGYGTPNYASEEEVDMTKEELLSVADTGDNPTDWAKEATEKMKDLGIFNGDGIGNFGWQQPITREAVAVVLANFMEKFGL